MSDSKEEIRKSVSKRYADIAQGKTKSCCGTSSCCGGDAKSNTETEPAKTFGYDTHDLASLPGGADMGLSCGNPVALASLREGDVVLDLGSGGGFDVFIAGRKVGAAGRIIGVDMTPEMLTKARNNTAAYREQAGLDNVEFRLGEIEHLPVADATVDVVISNCVINLSPDKPRVWHEITRVLKPGGRVSVSDIALLKPLPQALQESIEALVGCVAGAVFVEETIDMVHSAGLTNTRFEYKSDFIDTMFDSQDPLFEEIINQLTPGTNPGDFVTSLSITAHKPSTI